MSETIIDWQSHCDDDGILWLILDKQDSDTNVLSVSVLEPLLLVYPLVQNWVRSCSIGTSGDQRGRH